MLHSLIDAGFQFGCVVADPPWRFDNTSTRGAAEDHYETLSPEDLFAMPVKLIAAENAHLYLWTTDSHLPTALTVMMAWDFDFKQTISWVKTKGAYLLEMPKLQIGLGNYFRHSHELCLFGVRGKAPARAHNLPSVIFAPRGQHSAKPETLQDFAEQLSPGPYCELFARRPRDHWTTWGRVEAGKPLLSVTVGSEIAMAEQEKVEPEGQVEEWKPGKGFEQVSPASEAPKRVRRPRKKKGADAQTEQKPEPAALRIIRHHLDSAAAVAVTQREPAPGEFYEERPPGPPDDLP